MQRVLDLDLDLFLFRVAHDIPLDGPRLDASDFPPWPLDDAMAFLEERCHLHDPLPGRAVEHHGEVFGLWRDGVRAGSLTAPFHVTHADAHADLGMSEGGYKYLLTEMLAKPPKERGFPRTSRDGSDEAMTDGNYLSFAIGCRWIADLTYAHHPNSGGDVHPYIVEGNLGREDGTIQLPYLTREHIRWLIDERPLTRRVPDLPPERMEEPAVPFTMRSSDEFCAPDPFDFVFLSRSPSFTPAEADPIYDAIRERFIDEEAFAR